MKLHTHKTNGLTEHLRGLAINIHTPQNSVGFVARKGQKLSLAITTQEPTLSRATADASIAVRCPAESFVRGSGAEPSTPSRLLQLSWINPRLRLAGACFRIQLVFLQGGRFCSDADPASAHQNLQ